MALFYLFTIPAGVTMDTTKFDISGTFAISTVGAAGGTVLGNGQIIRGTTNAGANNMNIVAFNSTQIWIRILASASTYGPWGANIFAISGTPDLTVSFSMTVPVV